MGLTISAGDTRATYITGLGLTFGQMSGVDADSTNGAQNIAAFFDRESTPLVRFVRGTAGTTNLVVKDQLGADCFINVQSGTTLTASATVVA